jgi:hypothetical protein
MVFGRFTTEFTENTELLVMKSAWVLYGGMEWKVEGLSG